jgi:hypothetical protein
MPVLSERISAISLSEALLLNQNSNGLSKSQVSGCHSFTRTSYFDSKCPCSKSYWLLSYWIIWIEISLSSWRE